MNPRLALYDLAHRHQLGAQATNQLFEAAGLGREPAKLMAWFWRGVAVLAGALGGLGIILWLAANWDEWGRMARFALLQGTLLAMSLGAATRPRLRVPLSLLVLLCMGGLLAYFGQTYQTGADPWQLFALWAVLSLPLCLGVRSDVLWAPWALVTMTAISLWTHAHTGHGWRAQPQDLPVYALAWAAAALVVTALSPALARHTGAGVWALRSAATLAVISVSVAGVIALFHSDVAPHYPLALALFALAAAALTQRRLFDVFVHSALLLSLDTLLVLGLGRYLFSASGGEPLIGKLLLLGLFAAGLLAASVNLVTRLARRHGVQNTCATTGAPA